MIGMHVKTPALLVNRVIKSFNTNYTPKHRHEGEPCTNPDCPHTFMDGCVNAVTGALF